MLIFTKPRQLRRGLILLCACYFCIQYSTAQVADTARLFSLYERAVVFDEAKLDSIAYFADYLEVQSKNLGIPALKPKYLRLRGLYHNMQGDYSQAIEHFIAARRASEELNDLSQEVLILSDLAMLYGNIKQYHLSIQHSLLCIDICKRTHDSLLLCNEYNNLGVTFSEMKQTDSALLMYNKALRIAEKKNDQPMVITLNNNIGDIHLILKNWQTAIPYFRRNLQYDLESGELGSLYTDYFNLAESYIGMRNPDSAQFYTNKVTELLPRVMSKKNQSDRYSLMARYYQAFGKYREAYEALQNQYNIDTSFVNAETNKAIVELHEKYRAQKREAENKLLSAEIDAQKLRTRNITILAICSVITATIVAISLYQNYKKNLKLQGQNELITRQNEKLADLNHEKNSLISVVSHDLSGPFANIKMWNQLLQMGHSNLTEEQKKAIQRTKAAVEQGEQLIRNILTVEKAETNRSKINLESFNLREFLEEMVEDHRPAAQSKAIELHFHYDDESITILSDKQLIRRISENLLSNAIKYSPPGKNIWVTVGIGNECICIRIKDEGVGISQEELPFLFSRYSRISSKPTSGESSTGLGLSIVKRIVEELNGKITCESEPGKGSVFTIVLSK